MELKVTIRIICAINARYAKLKGWFKSYPFFLYKNQMNYLINLKISKQLISKTK